MTFQVDDLITTKAQFEQHDVVFVTPIIKIGNHVKIAYFIDEDGNKFQLTEEIT